MTDQEQTQPVATLDDVVRILQMMQMDLKGIRAAQEAVARNTRPPLGGPTQR